MKVIRSHYEHNKIRCVIITTKDGNIHCIENPETVEVVDDQNHHFKHTDKGFVQKYSDRQIKLPFEINVDAPQN